MPWSLQWPLSPYLTVQLSEMPEIWWWVGGREGVCEELAPYLSLSFHRQLETTPTHSSCSQNYKPETWGRISLKNSKRTRCVFSCTVCLEKKAESFKSSFAMRLHTGTKVTVKVSFFLKVYENIYVDLCKQQDHGSICFISMQFNFVHLIFL